MEVLTPLLVVSLQSTTSQVKYLMFKTLDAFKLMDSAGVAMNIDETVIAH
jgi:hypothetical protein